MLNWPPAEAIARQSEFLKTRARRREAFDQLASRVDGLLSSGFTSLGERVEAESLKFRSSLAWTGGIALLLGFGIATLAMLRLVSLERQSDVTQVELRQMAGQVRTAQERERRFLSRELHDEVGQMLTGLRLELSGIGRLKAPTEDELAVRIGHAKNVVEKTLQVVRNIAMLLRPSMLDDLGLTPALTWLAKETARTSGIQIETEIDPKLNSLPDSYRTCLYRVVQEALTNAARHSNAAKATVTLKAESEWVTGSIADDGNGFDVAGIKPRGIGMVGMQERVRELGGDLRVVSKFRQGTRVELRLPMPAWPEVIHDSYPDRGRPWDRSDRVKTSH